VLHGVSGFPDVAESLSADLEVAESAARSSPSTASWNAVRVTVSNPGSSRKNAKNPGPNF
jgi:hypothetical protein